MRRPGLCFFVRFGPLIERGGRGGQARLGAAGRVLIERLGQLAHHLVAGRAQLAQDLAGGAQHRRELLGSDYDQGDDQDQEYFEYVKRGTDRFSVSSCRPGRLGLDAFIILVRVWGVNVLKTALVTDRRYLKHFAGRAHPERPQRLEALIEMAEALRRPGLRFYTPREASRAEIELCHDPDYVALVERTAGLERYDFDPDTHTCRDSFATATLAAGGVLSAVEAVADGAADNGFALVRPPGHHALAGRAMGFCLFNNVAIAARYLLQARGLGRVMIIDWDLHHGNGTQEIFYDSAQVLYSSLHQFPHYPGTGSLYERGAGAGQGYTINAPMPATFGDSEYLTVLDELILPLGPKFKPDFILVSAGFDCHFRDPLGAMRVTEEGFAAMARRVKRLAAECCAGKMVAALEGGYDLQALRASARAVLEEFGREADEPIHPPIGGGRATALVDRALKMLEPLWQSG